MQKTTRRGFLVSCAAATLAVASQPATAADLQAYRDAKPEHVTIRFDRDELETFRPALDLQGLDVRPTAIYAWSADSPEWDLTCHTFVVYYQTQYGSTSEDSHKEDREIAQVYTDEHGAVREAVYSAGHWTAYRNQSPNVYEADDGGQHVTLEVAETYHHHLETATVGNLGVDLEPLGTETTLFDEDTDRTQYEAWLHNGLAGRLRPGAWVNGDIMRFRDHYWAETRHTARDRWGASLWSSLAGRLPAFALPSEFENTEYNR